MSAPPVVLVCIAVLFVNIYGEKYQPNWKSLDARPTPAWYDEVKFGIFIHWGVFSVPSFGSEWFWERWQGAVRNPATVKFMQTNYRPGFTYADFAPQFTAEFFDPNKWADIISASGAKYVVLTSKHHEGFTLWPSEVSWNWNAMDVGPKRDLVGELASAIRNRTDIHFGLYHSLYEWFNRQYLSDKASNFTKQDFVKSKAMPELYEIVQRYKPEVIWSDGDWEANYTYWNAREFLAWLYNDRKTMPELYEIVNKYKPEVIWSDGGHGPDTYWNSTHFLAWLYNESPVKDTVATNDRWGSGTSCKHGGYYTCHDRYNPGHLLKHKWENCMTLDRKSWGYRREMTISDVLTMDDVTKIMAETISCGGNLLMNIGPTHDGRIVPIFEQRLRQVGSWMAVNSEAIYGTRPWTYQNDTLTPGVWYTSKSGDDGATVVYAIVLDWPEGDTLALGAPIPSHQTSISMLGYAPKFGWKAGAKSGIVVNIPPIPANKMPCEWAWVFKLQGLHGASERGPNLRFVGKKRGL